MKIAVKNNTVLSIQGFNYKPFGDTVNCSDVDRVGFIGKELDEENNYFLFGVRNYDKETGRIMQVDPLFEMFSNYNPYHYCYNNPISFKDPTCFAPEKEDNELQGKKKKVDKLQNLTPDYILLELRDKALQEVYYANCFALMNGFSLESYQKSLSSDCVRFADWVETGGGSGGGSGGNSRDAVWASFYEQCGNLLNTGRVGDTESKNGAWEIKRDWDNGDLMRFGAFYKKTAEVSVNKNNDSDPSNDVVIDCMDYQLSVLCDYAEKEGLPLELKGISYKDFDSPTTFKSALLRLSAKDLVDCTTAVPYNERQSGDMRLVKQKSYFHVVGYYDSVGLRQLVYGNLREGVKQPVMFNKDWTVMKWMTKNNARLIVGKNDNGKYIYDNDLTGQVLRWNVLIPKGK